jgi:importin-13
LETLSGIAKGLTRTLDGLSVLEGESDLNVQAEVEKIRLARDDPRATKLREVIFAAIRGVVELWSVDAGVGNVRPFFYCLFHDFERGTDNLHYIIGIKRFI